MALDFQRVLTLARVFARRSARSDFQREHALPEERAALAAAEKPVTDGLAQDYAAWRRSMLWLAAAVMCANLVLKGIGWIESLAAEGQAAGVTLLTTILFAVIPASTVLTFLAAWWWASLRRSRRLARFAWFVLFLTPLAASAVPWIKIIDPDLDPQAQIGGGFVIGFLLFFYVAPAVVALCAGIIRSSMTVKTLLPESPAPGWAAVLFGPFYGLMLLSLLVLLNQMLGSAMLLFAIGAMVVAPLLYVWNARRVLRPHTPAEATGIVLGIRRKAAALNLVGVVLLSIWMLEHVPNADVLDLLELVVGFLGSVLLLTVVAADFILAMLCLGYRKAKDFFGSSYMPVLDAKFEALEAVGLTRLDVSMRTTEMKAMRAEPPPPVSR